MRTTTIALAAVLLLSASAAFAAGSDNKNAGDGSGLGGAPVGPTGNLMTSGVNPVYHPWMVYGRGPVASRARRMYGRNGYGFAGSAYGYAGNSYASAATPRVRRSGRPGAFGYGFGTHEEEDPPGLLPVPRR